MERYGLQADLLPEAYHSEALCEAFIEKVANTDVVWYPKAANADESIKKKLANSCHFVQIPVYENRPQDDLRFEEEFSNEWDAVFFTCASSVERVMEALKGVIPDSWKEAGTVISIGPKCSAVLEKYGIIHYIEADSASYEAMIDVVLTKELEKKHLGL